MEKTESEQDEFWSKANVIDLNESDPMRESVRQEQEKPVETCKSSPRSLRVSGEKMTAFDVAQAKLREKKLISSEEHQACLEVLKEMNDTSFFNANGMLRSLYYFKVTGDLSHRKIATVYAKAFMTDIHRRAFSGLASYLLDDGGAIARKIMLAGNKGAIAMQEAFG